MCCTCVCPEMNESESFILLSTATERTLQNALIRNRNRLCAFSKDIFRSIAVKLQEKWTSIVWYSIGCVFNVEPEHDIYVQFILPTYQLHVDWNTWNIYRVRDVMQQNGKNSYRLKPFTWLQIDVEFCAIIEQTQNVRRCWNIVYQSHENSHEFHLILVETLSWF